MKKSLNWFLLFLLLLGFGAIFYFHLYDYLSLNQLQKYHTHLLGAAQTHYMLTVVCYMTIYLVAAALAVPGALIITIAGGFLFGPISTLYVVLSATMGAGILFTVLRTTLGEWCARKAQGLIAKFEKGFQEDAFNYILVLRLIPIFPFLIVNVVSALLAAPLRTFLLATLLGLIPSTFVYTMVGNSLHVLFETHQTISFKILFKPFVILPLAGLALLAMLPLLYKWMKHAKNE